MGKLTWNITWKIPVVLRKPMLSIKKETALFNSLVSTFSGKVNDLELNAPALKLERTACISV